MFDDEWNVIKLDEHRYYKMVSGYGLSGVDFIAVHPECGLALIEMKNYLEGHSSIPNDLSQVMEKKQRDTLRLIRIVNIYYSRKWYFRLVTKLGIKQLYSKNWQVWTQAQTHINNKNYFFVGVIDY